ncbi:MAG: tetratricopeptide repeat protein [Lachnospiraceae bacterium]|nr:tetratricopeptide repeat protein [Lachnospiraceae bacterium]
MKYWEVLGIEPSTSKTVIREAYLKQLPKVNPEIDQEGFMRLREAYDAALEYAKNNKNQKMLYGEKELQSENESVFSMDDNGKEPEEKKESDEVLEKTESKWNEVLWEEDFEEDEREYKILEKETDRWFRELKDIYADFGKRINPQNWEKLLASTIHMGIEAYKMAQFRLVEFLLQCNEEEKCHLPVIVRKLLVELFDEFSILYFDYNSDYVFSNAEYVIFDKLNNEYTYIEFDELNEYILGNEDELDYSALVWKKGQDVDLFIKEYLNIKQRVEFIEENDEMGKAPQRCNDLQDILIKIENVEKIGVYNSNLEFMKLELCLRMGKYDEVRRGIETLLIKHKKEKKILASAYVLQARLFKLTKCFEEEKDALKKAVTYGNKDYEIYKALCDEEMEKGNIEDAIHIGLRLQNINKQDDRIQDFLKEAMDELLLREKKRGKKNASPKYVVALAEAYLRKGNWKKTREIMENLTLSDHESKLLWCRLYCGEEKYDLALKYIEELLEDDKENTLYLKQKADILLQQYKYDEYLNLLSTILEIEPDYLEVQMERLQGKKYIHYKVSVIGDEIWELKKIHQKYPNYARVVPYMFFAEDIGRCINEGLEETDKIRKEYQDRIYLKLDFQCIQLITMIEKEEELKPIRKLAEELQKATKEEVDNAFESGLYYYALYLYEEFAKNNGTADVTGSKQEVENGDLMFQKVKWNYFYPYFLERRMDIIGKFDFTDIKREYYVQELKKALEQTPDAMFLGLFLHAIYKNNLQYEEAIETLKPFVDKDVSGEYNVCGRIGTIYDHIDDMENSKKYLLMQEERFPDAFVYWRLAETEPCNFKLAEQYLDDGMKLIRSKADAWYFMENYAQIYIPSNQLDKLLQKLDQYRIEEENCFRKYYNLYLQVYLIRNEYEKAEDTLSYLKWKYPDLDNTYELELYYYEETSQFEKAIEVIKKLIERSEEGSYDKFQYHMNIAYDYFNLGKYEKMKPYIEYINKEVQSTKIKFGDGGFAIHSDSFTEDSEYYMVMGYYYYGMEEYEKAAREFQNAIDIELKNQDFICDNGRMENYYFKWYDSMVRIGKKEEAKKTLMLRKEDFLHRPEIRRLTKPLMNCFLGEFCCLLEDYEGALKYYEEAVNCSYRCYSCTYKKCVHGYYGLGMVYEKLGEAKKAREAFATAYEDGEHELELKKVMERMEMEEKKRG